LLQFKICSILKINKILNFLEFKFFLDFKKFKTRKRGKRENQKNEKEIKKEKPTISRQTREQPNKKPKMENRTRWAAVRSIPHACGRLSAPLLAENRF
jgi:hypothetical protein